MVNSIKIVNQESHFMEYFYCVLNSSLKSLSPLDTKGNFVYKLKGICEFLHKANTIFLGVNGYAFSLHVAIERESQKRKIKDEIEIPLDDCKLRTDVCSFFFKFLNQRREDVTYTFKLQITKSKLTEIINSHNVKTAVMSRLSKSFVRKMTHRKKRKTSESMSDLDVGSFSAEKRSYVPKDRTNTDMTLSVFMEGADEVHSATRKILNMKNLFRNKISKKTKEIERNSIDFEYMTTPYIGKKSMNYLIDNPVVRLLSFYVYRQHRITKRMNWLPGLIFILMIIQMVTFPLTSALPLLQSLQRLR